MISQSEEYSFEKKTIFKNMKKLKSEKLKQKYKKGEISLEKYVNEYWKIYRKANYI